MPRSSDPSPRPAEGLLVANRCSTDRIDPLFQPLIDEVTAAIIDVIPEGIVDIRLQGSVARGEAVIRRSDIDFNVLLDTPPSSATVTRLQDEATRFGCDYPIVSRVDLDVAVAEGLTAFQRCMLSSDSLNLYGIDQITRRTQRLERKGLARLVTPDIATTVCDFRT